MSETGDKRIAVYFIEYLKQGKFILKECLKMSIHEFLYVKLQINVYIAQT